MRPGRSPSNDGSRRAADVRHSLVDLEVHPRVIMRILRHADVSMTMEIYANASSTATSEALRRLGESLR